MSTPAQRKFNKVITIAFIAILLGLVAIAYGYDKHQRDSTCRARAELGTNLNEMIVKLRDVNAAYAKARKELNPILEGPAQLANLEAIQKAEEAVDALQPVPIEDCS